MREDKSSRRRRVRDVPPLVHGTLDLRTSFDAHVEGCRMNAGLKRPAMHAIVQFPPQLGVKLEARAQMLRLAVAFINETHGGNAVFAARLDQDEAGLATVDVFYSPKYLKEGKRRSELWISTSKHGKEIAEKHRDEIERRNKGQFSTAPRHIGIAMQAELYGYLGKHGLKLEARAEKAAYEPDRLEPEVGKARIKAQADLEKAACVKAAAEEAERQAAERRKQIEAAEAEVRRRQAAAQADQEEAAQRLAQIASLQKKLDALRGEVEALLARLTTEIEEAGRTTAALMVAAASGQKAVLDTTIARRIWPIVRPVVTNFAGWWKKYRARVEALPEPHRREVMGEIPVPAVYTLDRDPWNPE